MYILLFLDVYPDPMLSSQLQSSDRIGVSDVGVTDGMSGLADRAESLGCQSLGSECPQRALTT